SFMKSPPFISLIALGLKKGGVKAAVSWRYPKAVSRPRLAAEEMRGAPIFYNEPGTRSPEVSGRHARLDSSRGRREQALLHSGYLSVRGSVVACAYIQYVQRTNLVSC